MSDKIATEQYIINVSGGETSTPTKCATKSKVELYGLKVNGTYQILTHHNGNIDMKM